MLLVKGLFRGRSITSRQVIPREDRTHAGCPSILWYWTDHPLLKSTRHLLIVNTAVKSNPDLEVIMRLASFGTSFDCATVREMRKRIAAGTSSLGIL